VRYRSAQIETLTDRSLSSTKDRVHLWLALLALSPMDAPTRGPRRQSSSS
jgi:DNA-binding PucR family transcriptional regulator